PTMRPASPSIGMAPIQRRRTGKIASSPGTNISSQIPPSVFAIGVCTARERNHRPPSIPMNTGSRNAPMPQNCRTMSETYAPKMPIQLRAACDPVSTDALFIEGSSGEYETNARKRSRAETHIRNPASSFSRRFLVGVKILEKNVMWHERRRARLTLSAITGPEPNYYDKKERFAQCEKGTGWQVGFAPRPGPEPHTR